MEIYFYEFKDKEKIIKGSFYAFPSNPVQTIFFY